MAEVEEKKVNPISPIANPLAGKKLTKKILKLTKKAAPEKSVRRGVKEVVKCLRKGEKGLCILAGDVSPIDVITHIPVLCEDQEISFVFVPSKEALGTASATKRPTSVILIVPSKSAEWKGSYEEVIEEVKALRSE